MTDEVRTLLPPGHSGTMSSGPISYNGDGTRTAEEIRACDSGKVENNSQCRQSVGLHA